LSCRSNFSGLFTSNSKTSDPRRPQYSSLEENKT